MLQRQITNILERYAQIYPIVGITGPRQSGKTTIAKAAFSHLPYVSLENMDFRVRAQQDPRAFLKKYEQGAIFDEIQYAPELLSYLQEMVDASRTMGRFVITGSQNFAISEKISQSLAGRVGMTTLLPLSITELKKHENSNKLLFEGGYPGLIDRHMHPLEFYPSYLQTYVERDVRQIKKVEDLGTFQKFIKLCAGRIGQVVNYSSLGQDAGVSHTTARDWLSILEASYILFPLQPYYNNFSKRLIKSPKIYFYDTGLACSLLGIEKEEQLETHYLRGGLYENLALLEIIKGRFNRGLPANLYFWRDKTGHEVDIIGDWGGKINAFEVKANATFNPKFIQNVQYLHKLDENIQSYLIYDGTQDGSFEGTELLPLNKIDGIF